MVGCGSGLSHLLARQRISPAGMCMCEVVYQDDDVCSVVLMLLGDVVVESCYWVLCQCMAYHENQGGAGSSG